MNNKNVLVVEDNAIIGKNITNAILKDNPLLNIKQATTLNDAFESFKTTDFDLITLDLSLPDGNGIELLKMFQENKIQKKVLVFSTNIQLKMVCLKYGAFAFFDKVKDFEQFIATANTLI